MTEPNPEVYIDPEIESGEPPATPPAPEPPPQIQHTVEELSTFQNKHDAALKLLIDELSVATTAATRSSAMARFFQRLAGVIE